MSDILINGESYNSVWINGNEYTSAWALVDGVPTQIWGGGGKSSGGEYVFEYGYRLIYLNTKTSESRIVNTYSYNLNTSLTPLFCNRIDGYILYSTDIVNKYYVSDTSLKNFICFEYNMGDPYLYGTEGRLVCLNEDYSSDSYCTFKLSISFENKSVSIVDKREYVFKSSGYAMIVRTASCSYSYGKNDFESLALFIAIRYWDQGGQIYVNLFNIDQDEPTKIYNDEQLFRTLYGSYPVFKFENGTILILGGGSNTVIMHNDFSYEYYTGTILQSSNDVGLYYRNGYYYFARYTKKLIYKTSDFNDYIEVGNYYSGSYNDIKIINSKLIPTFTSYGGPSIYYSVVYNKNNLKRIDNSYDYDNLPYIYEGYGSSTQGRNYNSTIFLDNLTLQQNNNTFAMINYVSPPKISGLYNGDVDEEPIVSYSESGMDVTKNYGDNYKTDDSSPYNVLYNKYPNAQEVIIDSNIVKIGNNAFRDCDKLTYINIPNDCEIGDYAFYNCSNLSGYVSYYNFIVQDCKSVGEYSFSKCSLRFSSTGHSLVLSQHSFDNASICGEMTIDSEIIPSYAFNNCDIRILNDTYVTTIMPYAFKDCPDLHSLDLAHPTIYKNAFTVASLSGVALSDYNYDCYKIDGKLIKVMQDGVYIKPSNSSLFAKIINQNMDKDIIPFNEGTSPGAYDTDTGEFIDTLKNLGADITKDYSSSSYQSDAKHPFTILKNMNCDKVITDVVDRIGSYSFYHCRLFKIYIPEGVKIIGSYAFYDSCLYGLRIIEIPASVTTIEPYAIMGYYYYSNSYVDQIRFKETNYWYAVKDGEETLLNIKKVNSNYNLHKYAGYTLIRKDSKS